LYAGIITDQSGRARTDRKPVSIGGTDQPGCWADSAGHIRVAWVFKPMLREIGCPRDAICQITGPSFHSQTNGIRVIDAGLRLETNPARVENPCHVGAIPSNEFCDPPPIIVLEKHAPVNMAVPDRVGDALKHTQRPYRPTI